MKDRFVIGILMFGLISTANLWGQHLLINEVSRGEVKWVEIYNPTMHDVNLDGWKLRNSNGEDMLSGVIQAHGYLVVCESRSELTQNFEVQSQILELPDRRIGSGLNANADMLVLLDNRGRIVDFVNWGHPNPNWRFYFKDLWNPGVIASGSVIGRLPNALDRDLPDDFRGLGMATPGAMNQTYAGLGTASWGKIKAIFAGQKHR